jgi:hypothetical protein
MSPIKQFRSTGLQPKSPGALRGTLRCIMFDPPKKSGEYLIYWPSKHIDKGYCFHTCSFSASSNEWLSEIHEQAYWLDIEEIICPL